MHTTQKKLLIRFLKENKLYNKTRNLIINDYFPIILNTMYINNVLHLLRIYVFSKIYNKNIEYEIKIINGILYNIIPNERTRIVIKKISDIDKFIKYMNNNGFIWSNNSVINNSHYVFNYENKKYFIIDNGKLCWCYSEIWLYDSHHKYSFYETDEHFYAYWEKIKINFNKNIHKIIKFKKVNKK